MAHTILAKATFLWPSILLFIEKTTWNSFYDSFLSVNPLSAIFPNHLVVRTSEGIWATIQLKKILSFIKKSGLRFQSMPERLVTVSREQ